MIELVRENYERGLCELKIRLARGYVQPLKLNGTDYSVEEAENAIELLKFGIERLEKAGLVPIE